ncbi:aldehyde dehydrogenase family protein [Rhizobium laguerreae]|uniref:aldehyde dehydrogenase family protein n=1 Tax=Rhizobium laguerreae TaxID=1076926 RepID=UPI001C922611|nr:aldehyde dehydrogenase family protein [Rhizobium laguerreae]MBY3381825.1 aldehyde dehydrogenase [Rhizobium laguerreae]
MRNYSNWINGIDAAPENGAHMERTSPWDGAVIAQVPDSTAGDVDKAVRAARQAFNAWSGLPGSERATALSKWADLMNAQLTELAAVEGLEAGKPKLFAEGESSFAAELVRYAASQAWNITGKLMHDSGPDKLGLVLKLARGVVGLILPWNYPLVCLMQKLPFALAAGCTVVIKPSEFTPGSTLLVARLAKEAGIPDGVVNVVIGNGATVGEAITSHQDVDMVSFTGSSAVGKKIATNAANRVAPVTLELGGKGANIIFADADIEKAVEGALQGFIINAGEECCAGSRILVEESIHDEFVARLRERASKVRIGGSDSEETELGPLIHKQHLERVAGYIEAGKQEGAKLLCGGVDPSLNTGGGLFVPPTVFTGVTAEMKIFREEIFGPVASVIPFKSLDDALLIANDTRYGLANGVWTKNIDKAIEVIRRLESGMVYVNCYLETIAQLPFGGMKESGLGRENGTEGLEEYLETRAAFIKLDVSI